MLVLKKQLRRDFKKPFGKLYKSIGEIENSILENHLIISIGDATTKNLLNMSITPNIGIVDHKIERKPSENKIKYNAIILDAKNPPGTITNELWETIKNAFNIAKEPENKILIIVDGEEDLAVIPSVLESPEGSIILYGQPGEGVVVVKVDEVRKTAENMLDKFEVEGNATHFLNHKN